MLLLVMKKVRRMRSKRRAEEAILAELMVNQERAVLDPEEAGSAGDESVRVDCPPLLSWNDFMNGMTRERGLTGQRLEDGLVYGRTTHVLFIATAQILLTTLSKMRDSSEVESFLDSC